MKIDWSHAIFSLIMVIVWIMVMFSFMKIATDKKEDREQYLRDNFSPISEDPEIKKAYEAIIENK